MAMTSLWGLEQEGVSSTGQSCLFQQLQPVSTNSSSAKKAGHVGSIATFLNRLGH